MTMFSQKAPFDLTEFLSKPATSEARRLTAAQRRNRWPTGPQRVEETLAAPEVAPKSRPKSPKE